VNKNCIRFELTDLIKLFYYYLFEKKPKRNFLSKFVEVPWENHNFKLQTLVAISTEFTHHVSIPNWSILISEIIGCWPNNQNIVNHPKAINFLFKPKNLFELFVEKKSQNKYFESYNLTYVPVFNYYIGTLDSLSLDGFEKKKIAIGKIEGSVDPNEAAIKIIKSFLKKEEMTGNSRNLLEIKKNEIFEQKKLHDCLYRNSSLKKI